MVVVQLVLILPRVLKSKLYNIIAQRFNAGFPFSLPATFFYGHMKHGFNGFPR